jgi:hypothetical protein
MEERKVKGTIIVDFVKMIKKNRDLDWNKYLKAEDWGVVNSFVLASKWYSFAVFERCARAVFALLGNGNMEAAHAEGRRAGHKMFETVYSTVVQQKDPMTGLNLFVSSYGALFNFNPVRMERVTPRHARILYDYDAGDRFSVAFCHLLKGIFEALIEKTDGKNGTVAIASKQWENAPLTSFDITWE